jgi:hypothetical protein
MLRKALVGSLVVASLSGIAASQASADEFVVRITPPAPRAEYVPAPRYGYVWSPGFWDWRGHRYVWVAGSYVQVRPGYSYVAPRWYEHSGGWVIERGHWDRGDRDRDGVPNRFDRFPDNPYRR